MSELRRYLTRIEYMHLNQDYSYETTVIAPNVDEAIIQIEAFVQSEWPTAEIYTTSVLEQVVKFVSISKAAKSHREALEFARRSIPFGANLHELETAIQTYLNYRGLGNITSM